MKTLSSSNTMLTHPYKVGGSLVCIHSHVGPNSGL